MEDKIVRQISNALEDLAFANGINEIYPIIDDIVNRLRSAGFHDEEILFHLLRPSAAVSAKSGMGEG